MSGTPENVSVRRIDHADANRLAWAFSISLVFHLFVWGAWFSAHRLGLVNRWEWARWAQYVPVLSHIIPKHESASKQPQAQREPPLMFVNVSESQAVTEAPEKPKFYSSKNSKAANPKANQETGMPKIEGTQTQVARTEAAPRKEFVPLQPAPPKEAQPAQQDQEEEKAAPKQPAGDLAFNKTQPNGKSDVGKDQRSRPRTVAEARKRLQDSAIPGEKMSQEGGVRRRLDIASLDAIATPYGEYDAALVKAVEQRWYSLLNERSYASDSRGKVVLHFVLHQDGRITEMTVADNTAGEVLGLICQKAVLDPAPYAAWPAEMKRTLGNTRNIQFTFYYN